MTWPTGSNAITVLGSWVSTARELLIKDLNNLRPKSDFRSLRNWSDVSGNHCPEFQKLVVNRGTKLFEITLADWALLGEFQHLRNQQSHPDTSRLTKADNFLVNPLTILWAGIP
eukprot:TRINITY_DN16345_c0_g1::TRINITY_DN16345_c0_g1_i1::g.29488::m.29488 TRINITY_DN16345_c0_g1::TRINITY_DN16345_c0_g1_i1::g.29488  ORF type:complete len:114 (-),score=1.69 TRINITY_DN16345_c0_g1_i1:14-355(-)